MCIDTMVKKVNDAHLQSQVSLRRSLDSAKEAGEILNEIKSKKLYGKHGTWKPWLGKKFPEISDRQLAKYMRLAANWSKIQTNIGEGAATIDDALKAVAKPAATKPVSAHASPSPEATRQEGQGKIVAVYSGNPAEMDESSTTQTSEVGTLSCSVAGRVSLAIEPLEGFTMARVHEELQAGTAFVDQGEIMKSEGEGAPLVIAKVWKVTEEFAFDNFKMENTDRAFEEKGRKETETDLDGSGD